MRKWDIYSYFKKFDGYYIIFLLYVDDMLVTGSSMKEINKLKWQLAKEFELKDLGEANQILGMRITRNKLEGTLILSQEKYIEKVLSRVNLQDANTRSTPLARQFKLCKDKFLFWQKKVTFINDVRLQSTKATKVTMEKNQSHRVL